MRRSVFSFAAALLLLMPGAPISAIAQNAPPPQGAPSAPAFSTAQLDQMVAPVALYPDALLSQVLMASTYPSDVAEAVTWAKANQSLKGDDAVKAVENQPWDPSVQSLVAFPQVLAIMGEKPEWVQNLGDAFLAQPNDVMDSVQRLRAKAQQAGNLQSTPQQTVASEPAPPPAAPLMAGAPPPPAQIITIVPANPQVVYVPSYNPTYVYGGWPYPAYPPYYIPPPPGWGFVAGAVTAGIAWGVGIGVTNALWGGVNWHNNSVNINVNNYNNINVHNRINSNNNNVNWNHNAANRHGVPYQPASGRLYQNQTPGAQNRQDYRGRDAQRQQAESALSNRVGADNMNRQSLSNVDRSTLQNRGGGGQYGGGARDFNQSQERNRNTGNYDNAFRGAGNNAQTRQQIDRGAASRDSMNRQNANRGEMNRPQQRPEARAPQQRQQAQRPSGGRPEGGGGRPAGGGGGGGGGRRR